MIAWERLAELLARRLSACMPPPLRVEAHGSELRIEHPDGPVELVRLRFCAGSDIDDLVAATEHAIDRAEDAASEKTAEQYAGQVAAEGGRLRLWFGRVPRPTPAGEWRDVVPELEPIVLAWLTSRRRG